MRFYPKNDGRVIVDTQEALLLFDPEFVQKDEAQEDENISVPFLTAGERVHIKPGNYSCSVIYRLTRAGRPLTHIRQGNCHKVEIKLDKDFSIVIGKN